MPEIPDRQIYFAIFCGLIIIGIVVELIRRRQLQEQYSVLWIVAALIFMTYNWWYPFALWFTGIIGVKDVVSIILFFGIFMCALFILQLCVKISEFSYKIKNLIQEVSILRYELEQYKAKESNSN